MSITLTYFLKEALMQNPHYGLIEGFFFAYREFVGEADSLLKAYGFGRAHHRVLHFVHRHEEISVNDILDILQITKQSLSRVLKELIDEGFILQREGVEDRRKRFLSPTKKGRALALLLAKKQTARLSLALQNASLEDVAVEAFFKEMLK
jgi:DNA-binding MarR family transcriptional regulator